jgi:DNA-binding NarL/FixJ family response regulator
MRTVSSPPSLPIRLSPLALTELVSAAVEEMLRGYADRALFGREWPESCDVGLIDPELLPRVWHNRTGLPLVAISRDGSSRTARRAESLHVSGLVGPRVSVEELIGTAEQACRESERTRAQEFKELTSREIEVVTMICAGSSNADIADALFLSVNTVKTNIRTAYRKMGVASRSQAVLWGVHHGIGPG